MGLADARVAIVCHSTIAIGTTERLIAETGKPLVFMPEYAGEADHHPLRDPRNRRFLIYGGHDPATSAVQALYERAYGPELRHFCVPPTVAEVVKYMENAFLATKVAFCNDFFDLCAAVGVDYNWARLLWLQDDRINPSHTLVTEERGYGGQCLPKDTAAVSTTGRDLGVPMEILEAVQRANARHRSGAPPSRPRRLRRRRHELTTHVQTRFRYVGRWRGLIPHPRGLPRDADALGSLGDASD